MKDRTLLLSALIACCIHALLLLLNFGVPRPTLASAVPSIEVTLVGPPQPALPPAPEPAPPPKPVPQKAPEPEVKPEQKPTVEPEPIPEVEIRVEPVEEEAVEKLQHAAEPVPAEPVVEETVEVAKVPSVEGGISRDAVEEARASARTEFQEATVDGPSAYVYNPKPEYPRKARLRGEQGTVLLLVEVLPSGRVGEITVEKSSGYEMLDEAAVKAVRRWRFEPAKRGIGAVRAWARIPVEFSLKD